MSRRYLAERLDRSIRDIHAAARPFGCVFAEFGGDFRLTPPVLRRGIRAKTVASSTKRSPLWEDMRRRRLTRGCRLDTMKGGIAKYLIQIGDGGESIAAGAAYIGAPSVYARILLKYPTRTQISDARYTRASRQGFPTSSICCRSPS